MKHISNTNFSTGRRWANACTVSCQKLLARLGRVKAALRQDFGGRLGRQEQMLQLALNEAEAQAWETGFPQLVFPMLAQEKAEQTLAWSRRQQSLLQAAPIRLEAA